MLGVLKVRFIQLDELETGNTLVRLCPACHSEPAPHWCAPSSTEFPVITQFVDEP